MNPLIGLYVIVGIDAVFHGFIIFYLLKINMNLKRK